MLELINETYAHKQKALFDELETQFAAGLKPSNIYDRISNYDQDKRSSLTLIVRPPKSMIDKIMAEVIKPLSEADPRQYYYTPQSLHLTLLCLTLATDPPAYQISNFPQVISIIKHVLKTYHPLDFKLQDLFKLPNSLGIRAYSTSALSSIINELRQQLKPLNLADKLYLASDKIYFSNITVCRYTTKPNQLFMQKLNELQNVDIGLCDTTNVELVTSNFAFSPNKIEIQQKFVMT